MLGTLIRLKRFAGHVAQHTALDEIRCMEKPKALPQLLIEGFSVLSAQRGRLDDTIIAWCNPLSAADLNRCLSDRNMKGEPLCKPTGSLIMHFFIPQTHHRGRVITLLMQRGLDVGITDLVALIPDC